MSVRHVHSYLKTAYHCMHPSETLPKRKPARWHPYALLLILLIISIVMMFAA